MLHPLGDGADLLEGDRVDAQRRLIDAEREEVGRESSQELANLVSDPRVLRGNREGIHTAVLQSRAAWAAGWALWTPNTRAS